MSLNKYLEIITKSEQLYANIVLICALTAFCSAVALSISEQDTKIQIKRLKSEITSIKSNLNDYIDHLIPIKIREYNERISRSSDDDESERKCIIL
jgi:hypothetical protein